MFATIFSSIFGILLPNIVALSVVLYQSEWQVVVRHFGELLTFGSFANYWLLSINQILTGVWIMLCAIIGTVHYLRKRRSDSIRTRMLYSFFCSNKHTFHIVFYACNRNISMLFLVSLSHQPHHLLLISLH